MPIIEPDTDRIKQILADLQDTAQGERDVHLRAAVVCLAFASGVFRDPTMRTVFIHFMRTGGAGPEMTEGIMILRDILNDATKGN